MVCGNRGIGKSEGVGQFARRIGLPLVARRAAQMMEGDVLGIPGTEDMKGLENLVNRYSEGQGGSKVTTFAPPGWFARACVEPCVLFLDEIDRASLGVEQALFELADSRTISGYKLHPGTIIISAVNGGLNPDQDNYKVSSLDAAGFSRWTAYLLQPTVDDWLDYGRSKDENGRSQIHPVMIKFIDENRPLLEGKVTSDISEKSPDRRAWKRLSDTMRLMFGEKFPKEDQAILLSVACGHVGTAAGSAFVKYYSTALTRVTKDDVLRNNFDVSALDSGAMSQIEQKELAEALVVDCYARHMTNLEVQGFCNFFHAVNASVAKTVLTRANGVKADPNAPPAWVFLPNANPAKSQAQMRNVVVTMRGPDEAATRGYTDPNGEPYTVKNVLSPLIGANAK
jgi:hypothetical protein